MASTSHLTEMNLNECEYVNDDEVAQFQNEQKNSTQFIQQTVNQQKYFYFSDWFKFEQELKWGNIILFCLFHLLGLYGVLMYPYAFDKKTLLTMVWFYIYGWIGGFGLSAGVHRFWSHRSYKATLPWRIILMCAYCSTGQNTIYDWVRDHRVHHKFSETSSDPHNAKRGFIFAHFGWLMMKKNQNVIEQGKKIDLSDLFDDSVIRFHLRYFLILKLLFAFIIPTIVPVYYWNETWLNAFLLPGVWRFICLLHGTFLINSVAHMWGNKPYDKRINPTENVFVTMAAMGEGWHNYHHSFPSDYRSAELKYFPMNITTSLIDLMAKIGWIYDRKVVTPEMIKKYIAKYGDGSKGKFNKKNE